MEIGDSLIHSRSVRQGKFCSRWYHPVVAGPGYDIYYLNFLAGSARALFVAEDPNHVWIRSAWGKMDDRLPMIREECLKA